MEIKDPLEEMVRREVEDTNRVLAAKESGEALPDKSREVLREARYHRCYCGAAGVLEVVM